MEFGPTNLKTPVDATESQTVTKKIKKNPKNQLATKGHDGEASGDLFPNVVKLCAKFNKSKDHKDFIHVGQVGLGISGFGQDR